MIPNYAQLTQKHYINKKKRITPMTSGVSWSKLKNKTKVLCFGKKFMWEKRNVNKMKQGGIKRNLQWRQRKKNILLR
jgi:hypothetical protein